MGFISSFAKYIIFLFNFLIVVAALILIVFGVIFVVREDAGVKIFDNAFSLGGLAIGIGVIILLIAFFGCCGAIRQNPCMLTTYGIILLALFVTQVVLGILAIVQIHNEDEFRNEIRTLVKKLFDELNSHANNAFNNLQETFECCGVDGKLDHNTSNQPNYDYPTSCCKGNTSPCNQPYEQGCARAFADSIIDSIGIIGYVAIGFAAVELLGAIFAFMIQSRHRKSRQYA